MFCTQCGNDIYTDEAFCAVCGKKVTPRGNISPTNPSVHVNIPQSAPQYEYDKPGHYGQPPHLQSPQYPGHQRPRPNQRQHHHNYDYPPPPPHEGNALQKVAIAAACVALIALGISIGGAFLMQNSESTPPRTAEVPGPGVFETLPTPLPTPSPEPDYEQEYDPEPETGNSARFPFPGILSQYATTDQVDVIFLQNTLNRVRNYFTAIRHIETVSGNFEGVTRGAVIDFQVRAELTPTGVVDEVTWYSLMYVFENPPERPDEPLPHLYSKGT